MPVVLLSFVDLSASSFAELIVHLEQLLKACLLGILVGAIFFSSRPNKACTAGISTGNRNIRFLLLEKAYAVCYKSLLRSFCFCCGFLYALLFAVRGRIGILRFFFPSRPWSCGCRGKRMWACSALLFLSLVFVAPILSSLDHVWVTE